MYFDEDARDMGEVLDAGPSRLTCHTLRSRHVNGLKRLVAALDVKANGIDGRSCPGQSPFDGPIVVDIRGNRMQLVIVIPEKPSSPLGMT